MPKQNILIKGVIQMIEKLTQQQKNLISGHLFKLEAEKHKKDVLRVSLDTDLEVQYIKDLYNGKVPVTDKALEAFVKLYGKHTKFYVDFSPDEEYIEALNENERKNKLTYRSTYKNAQ